MLRRINVNGKTIEQIVDDEEGNDSENSSENSSEDGFGGSRKKRKHKTYINLTQKIHPSLRKRAHKNKTTKLQHEPLFSKKHKSKYSHKL